VRRAVSSAFPMSFAVNMGPPAWYRSGMGDRIIAPHRSMGLIAVFALAACAGAQPSSRRPPAKAHAPAPPGELAIESEPPGVLVFVEGKEVGTTPLVTQVESGSRLVSWSYQDRNYKPAMIDVPPGRRTEYRFRLNLASDDSPTRADQAKAGATAADVKLRALACLKEAHALGPIQATVRVALSPEHPPKLTVTSISGFAPRFEPCLWELQSTLTERTVSRPVEATLSLELKD
jgi:hypothetical protein